MRKISILLASVMLLSTTAYGQEKTRDELLKEAAQEHRDQARLQRKLDQEANFEEAFDVEFDMTPEQVRAVRTRQNQMEEAMSLPVPSQGITRSIAVSLEPGSRSPIIRAYPQYVTTIRVLDSFGNPWPIRAYMVGNASLFQVQKADLEPHDTLMLSPLTNVGSTNLTIMLDNKAGAEPVPPLSVQIIVNPGFSKNYDSITSLRINKPGPLSSSVVTTDGGQNFLTDDTMLSFLDGTPPKDALPMKTSESIISAWHLNEMLYVRSPFEILWPAWTKSVSSGEKKGGIHVYELPLVPSIMLSGNRMITLEKFPDPISRAMRGK